MKQITAKLVCERFDDSTGNEVAALTAVSTDDENLSWSEGTTPSASLTITVSCPGAHGILALGKEYDVTIKPAKE